MRLDLGEAVHCTDAAFGSLSDVAIEPQSKTVTHLVVAPHELDGVARLVPIDLAREGTSEGDPLTLACPVEATAQLSSVESYSYLGLDELPADDAEWDIGIERILPTAYAGSEMLAYSGEDSAFGVIYDRVPKGEVEIRRDSSIVAADGGYVGGVDGLLVDTGAQITHFIFDKGHLWRRREITIPISAVEKVETDQVTVRLSKKACGALPSTRLHRKH